MPLLTVILSRFIDGHQHVHQFPIIRDAVLNVYEKRLRQKNIYLRCTATAFDWRDLKNNIIQLSGAYKFKKLLLEKKIPHNKSFAGIYSFSQTKNYSEIFPAFLKKISDQGLIMCHPGLSESNDSIAAARVAEFNYFSSEKFLEDCKKNQITLLHHIKNTSIS